MLSDSKISKSFWKWKSETCSREGKGKFQNHPTIPSAYYTDADKPSKADHDHTADTALPAAPEPDFLDVFGNFVGSIAGNHISNWVHSRS